MERQTTITAETIAGVLALANRLEGEGQINISKLLRAGVISAINRAAFKLALPVDNSLLPGEIMRAVESLSLIETDKALLAALQRGAIAMAEGRLPLIDATPNPFVCRTCGHIELEISVSECPVCSAHPATFQAFLPVYWLEVFDPFQALEHLKATPNLVAGYLEGKSAAVLNRQAPDGGWSIYQNLVHLRDAQYLLNFRVNLMLEQDQPTLESQAVFKWASRENGNAPNPTSVYDDYQQSRQQTLRRLQNLPVKDWWRKGQHQEFGSVTILQQASYFAAHELTHLPQLASLSG